MSERVQTAARAFPLAMYGIALIFLVVAFVGAVQLVSSSVIGGLAAMLAVLITVGLVGWRISFKLKQLRTGS